MDIVARSAATPHQLTPWDLARGAAGRSRRFPSIGTGLPAGHYPRIRTRQVGPARATGTRTPDVRPRPTGNPLIQHVFATPHPAVGPRRTISTTPLLTLLQPLPRQAQPRTAVYGLLLYHHSRTTPARLSAGGFLASERAFQRDLRRRAEPWAALFKGSEQARCRTWHPAINRTTPPFSWSPARRGVTWVPDPASGG